MKYSIRLLAFRGALLAACLCCGLYFTWTYYKPNSDEAAITLTPEEIKYLLSVLEAGQEDPPFAWVTVSPKTTYVTEPLDALGRVDFLAAYNNFARKDVTPDNNATVRFVKAGYGLSDFSEEERVAFFQLLQIEPLPETGPYFSPFQPIDDAEKADFERAMAEPWSPEAFPRFESWLTENRTALEIVVEGIHCPCCYMPLVTSQSSSRLMNCHLPVTQLTRDFSRALVLRAMSHLHANRVSEAKRDLLDCHRLGRLIGGTHSLIVTMVGFDIDRRACVGDAALMSYGNFDKATALAYREELRQLPPMPDIFFELDYFQRLMMLETASGWSMKHYAFFLVNDESVNYNELTPEQLVRLTEMYDAMLRVCNEGFDRIAEIGRLPTYGERVRKTEEEVQKLRDYLEPIKGVRDNTDPRMIRFAAKKLQELKGATPTEVGLEIGKLVYSLALPMVPLLADAKAKTRVKLVDVGLTLVAFKAEHGAYPEALTQLVPEVFPEFPTDYFGDSINFGNGFLRYRWNDDGFRIYSLGPNLMDDGGRTETSTPWGDDLLLEVKHHKEVAR